jgi:PAS domain S-box-containing protein
LIRAHDWASTALGPPHSWPQGLKTAVRLLLSTQHPMFIWWGPDLIQFYNDAYGRSIGPERHPSALGERGRECWAEIWDLIGWQIERVMSGGAATWHENHLVPITRHGRREDVYWTYSYSPIDEPTAPNGIGGVLVVCTETTEQVLAEQRMAAAESRWRALFDQAPGFVCILHGPDHVFEYANTRYSELIGGRDLIGRPLRQALPEIEGQGFIRLLDDVYRAGESHVGIATPVFLDRAPSETRYLDFVYQAIRDSQGTITGVLAHGSDVTERVLAVKALEESDRRKNEFLAMLAHELRNPLAPIQNATELLSRAGVEESRSPMLVTIIKRQLSHLTRLVDDLLDVSRITQGRIELKTEVLDLASLVRQAVETTQHHLDAKEQNLRVTLAAQPLYVRADRARMIQCISNVLTNAAKYTDRGGTIRVGLRGAAGWAEVEIADNGIGLSPELLPHVFDIFVQGERGLDRSQGGLGIGLAIVRQLMALHAGEVTAVSDGPGRGATFRLRIPAITGSESAEETPRSPKPAARRILVVDDNTDSAESLASILELEAHTVSTASSGVEALRILEREAFDVVLLDIGLPEMDGYEVARRIRARRDAPRLIALTGYGQAEDRDRALATGFEAHLVKPVDIGILETLLGGEA